MLQCINFYQIANIFFPAAVIQIVPFHFEKWVQKKAIIDCRCRDSKIDMCSPPEIADLRILYREFPCSTIVSLGNLSL